ncbi:MAG: hypothetical protein V2B14_06620 [bacterium]
MEIIKDSINVAAKGLGKVYSPGLLRAMESWHENKIESYGRGLQAVNKLPETLTDISNSFQIIETVHDSNNFMKAFQDSAKINEFNFFKNTFLESHLDKSLLGRTALKADLNLLNTNFGMKILKTVDKDAEIKTIINSIGTAEKFIKGGKVSTFLAKAMARIPCFSILFSLALEIPNIIKASKNGDGLAQSGRSIIKVIGITAGSAIIGALLSPILPPIGSLAGSAIGIYLGNKISKKIGEAILNKPVSA